MRKNIEKSKACNAAVGAPKAKAKRAKVSLATARAMSAAARDAIENVWVWSGGPLADLFDEHTAVVVYEAMHDARRRQARCGARNRATKADELRNPRSP